MRRSFQTVSLSTSVNRREISHTREPVEESSDARFDHLPEGDSGPVSRTCRRSARYRSAEGSWSEIPTMPMIVNHDHDLGPCQMGRRWSRRSRTAESGSSFSNLPERVLGRNDEWQTYAHKISHGLGVR